MNNLNNVSFEEAYAELEQIIARLESGELPLDESVALFERGRKLSEHCQALLDKAELRIQQLTDDGLLKDL